MRGLRAALSILAVLAASPAIAIPGPPQIFFESGSSEITPAAAEILDMVIRLNKSVPPEVTNLLDGHADTVGSAEANLQLSCRRAQAVFDYMTARGVPPETFELIANGESRLVIETPDETPEMQNRRVMLLLQPHSPTEPTGRTCDREF